MKHGRACGGADRWPQRRAPARVAASMLVLAFVACVSQWSPPAPTGRHRTTPIAGAGQRMGAEICRDCHDSFEDHNVASTVHPDCESCHGPAELHIHTASADDIRHPGAADCAGCHEVGSRTLLGWTSSPHARAQVICSDCHDTHNRELRHVRRVEEIQVATLRQAGPTTRMCVGCHPEVRAAFDLPSHHPVGEGMVGCTDCHDPHESRRRTLGAINRQCVSCHQEVAGPWIYEHPPVHEDCGHCHAPHGASADHLLETSQPAVCISCHTIPIAGAIHQPYAFTTPCTDCHNAVHGSYADPHLRK